jgi:Gram-negative bacterial TonB protein C-terminal
MRVRFLTVLTLTAPLALVLAVVSKVMAQDSPQVLPKVIQHSAPLYPPLALQARIEGEVRVSITTDGESVQEASAETGPPLLRKAAEENVRTWRFAVHKPDTFHVIFRYKLLSDSTDVEFLELPAVVKVLVSPSEMAVNYACAGCGTSVEAENLYAVALFVSLAEMQKSWGEIDDSDGGSRVRTDYHRMPVEKDPVITDQLPAQFGEHRVEYLDTESQIARCKKLRKEFAILRVRPIQAGGGLLKIQVSTSWVSYKKGRLMFAVSDWSDVEFRYDCEKQNFVVSSVRLGGI